MLRKLTDNKSDYNQLKLPFFQSVFPTFIQYELLRKLTDTISDYNQLKLPFSNEFFQYLLSLWSMFPIALSVQPNMNDNFYREFASKDRHEQAFMIYSVDW